jgi:putative inorganic carbon (HCO3(-)) transporter
MASRLEPANWLPTLGLAGLSVVVGLLAGLDPVIALTASVALAFALVALLDLTAGLVIYTTIVFVQPGALVRPLIAAITILALAWLAKVLAGVEGERRTVFNDHPAIAWVLAAFLGWTAISTGWAESTTVSVQEFFRYLINVSLFVIVYTAVQDRRQAAWALGGYMFACAISFAYGLVVQPDPGQETERFTGGLADPNVLAAVLLPGIALSAGATLALRSLPLRLTAAGILALCLASFVFTASRGGLIAFAAMLLAAVVFAGRKRALAVVATLLVAIAALGYFGLVASEGTRERIEEPLRGESLSQETRVTLWQVAFRMVEDKPVAGVGAGNFTTSSVHYVLESGDIARTDVIVDTPLATHNTYLHVLVEFGIIGAPLFLVIVGFSLASSGLAIRNFRRSGDTAMEVMARALIVGQIGILSASFFFSAQTDNKLWLILGLGPAMFAVSRQVSAGRDPTGGQAEEPLRPAAAAYSSS